MKLNLVKSTKAGFSLVEMLVVIAVIGIIAAIAVPNIGRINDAAKDATYRRNAQNISSVFRVSSSCRIRLLEDRRNGCNASQPSCDHHCGLQRSDSLRHGLRFEPIHWRLLRCSRPESNRRR